jgi:hypothetical protein
VINGDIVDRGDMAVEILAVLMMFKLACDESVTIVRGNHETTAMNTYYGFQEEVLKNFDDDHNLLEKFRTFFYVLPFAAVIDNKAFVVHGGLGEPSKNVTIAELNNWNRKELTVIYHLLWSGKYYVCYTKGLYYLTLYGHSVARSS